MTPAQAAAYALEEHVASVVARMESGELGGQAAYTLLVARGVDGPRAIHLTRPYERN